MFVPTRGPSSAKAFYDETLGLRLVRESGFALVFDAGGTMLPVVTVQDFPPANYTALGWIVPDGRGAVRELSARGVAFRRYQGLSKTGRWRRRPETCTRSRTGT